MGAEGPRPSPLSARGWGKRVRPLTLLRSPLPSPSRIGKNLKVPVARALELWVLPDSPPEMPFDGSAGAVA